MLVSNTNQLITIIITSLILGACNFSPIRSNPQGSTAKQVRHAPEQAPEHLYVDPNDVKKYKNQIDRQETANALAENLWLEIANNLQFERNIKHPRVRDKIKWYARNQDYLDRVAERATPYLYHIVQQLKLRDMPLDLALLPIVESAYHPFAHSPSHASGIWQFIPGTGRQFGLKQNWWYDGRRDIVASTDAALTFLSKLNMQFNGDWPLAIASYNTGPRNVERAIKRNKKIGKPTDFWSLKLHRETRQYIPNLLAIAEIVAHPEKYNVKLKAIESKPYFVSVDTGSQLDLATVAELTGMEMDAIYTLNPGYSRWATDPDGPHRMLVPVEIANDFRSRLASLPKELRIRWQQHKIKNGETLSQIATRYSTNVSALKETNGLKNSRIRAGRSLLIPVSKRPLNVYTLSQDSRRYRGLKRGSDGQDYIYKVKRGDNLWDIGQHYGISVSQLCRWNGISKKSTLRLGQKLRIMINPQDDQPALLKTATTQTKNGLFKIDHKVRDGDSLWLISQRYGVSINQLRGWNNIRKGRYLQPGQSISIFTNKKPTGV